ncbi:MAG: hypothetical protein V1845_01625 [bacterium]
MDLEEIKKRLYTDKPELGARPEAPKKYEPGFGQAGQDSQGQGSWEKEPEKIAGPGLSSKTKKWIKTAVLVLAGLAVAAVGIWFIFFRSSFDSKKVSVIVYGRDRVVSGEEVSYMVRYQNGTKVDLKNVKLTFIYPEGSLPKDTQNLTTLGEAQTSIVGVPDLPAGQEGSMEFRASLTGLRGEQKQAIAKLSYNPGGASSEFENEGEFLSEIFMVPIVLDFDLPERIVSGQPLTIGLKYLNTSDVSFSGVTLSIEYPSGFDFNSSSPVPAEAENKWQLAEIGPREEGKIIISGVLSGLEGEVKSFKAKAEQKQGEIVKTVSEGLASTSISLSPLSVALTVNNSRDYSANPGETLNYKLAYQNSTDVQIGPVFIVVKFDSKVLDFSTLKTNGSFSSMDNSITWNESVLRQLRMLQPGDKNTIEFSLQVKEKEELPIKNFSDKNFLVGVSAKINSVNIPTSLVGTRLEGNDSLSTKLNSVLLLSAKGYFKDSIMPNSGPIPPTVGQQTTYTIYWQIVNLANEAENVVVESYLPPYVSWLGRFEPPDSAVKYDKNSGKITWTIGKLAANTGILSPVKQLVFQIALLPNSNQVGSEVVLVKESAISGLDAFTAASLNGVAKQIESDLPDDSSMIYGGGKIRQ